jgi:glycerol-3-phosphate acyltransferase PlsX
MIDLGANVDCTPEQLYQFAHMGAAITQANQSETYKPTVALLNIGSESIKGNEQTRQTHELLLSSELIDYQGFIEGNKVYQGTVDVIVCDGFVGNVLIKASEGVVHMVMEHMKAAFRQNIWRRLVASLADSVLKSFKKSVDPDQHNGASLVGLQGVVIKSHGAANATATLAAIEEAMREAQYDIPAQIQQRLGQQVTD